MVTIDELKELETPGTPLFLFDCVLGSGDIQRWSTHSVQVEGNRYAARVLKHNLFELKSSSDEITDGVSRISVTLANADSYLSAIERTIGWKGSQLIVRLFFFDLYEATPLSDSQVVFRGIANPPDESIESSLRLSFTNRLSLQRVFLPEVRIQKRCPWAFPGTASQRAEAVTGGIHGRWSPFYRCGYSADQVGGVGNLNGTEPFTTCEYTRASCEARGMFDRDNVGNLTRRFGGVEFVPSSITVRTYGERTSHLSAPVDNRL